MNIPTPVTPTTPIRLKASLHTLTVLQLYQTDLAQISQQLQQLVKQTPHFFQQLPVILDMQFLMTAPDNHLDLAALAHCLRQFGLMPMGIRSGTPLQRDTAQRMGWALFSDTPAITETLPITPPVSTHRPEAKIITDPVRSGQQIYAAGDLVVLGSVSPGAELLAEGHIHIYGRLSGRALAGISDNIAAYIFCQTLEAELVAIAGHYWLHEDLQKNTLKSHISLFLKDNQLQIRHLSV